jgi:hypothetical protein
MKAALVVLAVILGGLLSASAAVAAPPPVRDGKFEFSVTSVKCGVTTIGDPPLEKKAQGQYCLVTLTVTNIGDRSQIFDASSQKAENAQGQKYDADGTATFYLENPNSFLTPINPGNSVKGVVAFDVPANAKIVKLQLHDSPFSDGAEVSVA